MKEIQYLLYSTPQGDTTIQATIYDDTLWLTQKGMAELFGVQVPAISKHLSNIYEEGELNKSSTISKMETVVNRGFRGEVIEDVEFYNLDAIISVGYRVNSSKATHFRIWATKVLREYIQKGFVLDDERLKQGTATFGKDYFRELLDESDLLEQVSAEYGNKLQTYSKSVVSTTTTTHKCVRTFSQWCRINSTTQSQGRLQQKS